jgi:hypothetical protein
MTDLPPLPPPQDPSERPSATVEVLIDDEIIRERVRRIMGKPPPTPWWSQLSRHPIFALVLGFFLTWGVGTLLTGQINREREEREARAERNRLQTETSMQAIRELSQLLDARNTRADMFLSSLRRNAAASEIRERKRAYGEAVARWGSSVQANLFAIRDAVEHITYSPAESPVEGYLNPHYRTLDSLLLHAYDRNSAKRPPGELDSARLQLRRAAFCGTTIVDELYQSLAEQRRVQALPARQRNRGEDEPAGMPTEMGVRITSACDGSIPVTLD